MRLFISLLAFVSLSQAALASGADEISCLALSKGKTTPLVKIGTSPLGWEILGADIGGYHVELMVDEKSYLARIDLPNDTQISRSGYLDGIVNRHENVLVSLDQHGTTLISVLCQAKQ